MATAAASWEMLDGQAALAGVDLLALSPARLCNIVWSRLRQSATKDDEWVKLLTKLTRPLPGTRPSPALREFRRRHMP